MLKVNPMERPYIYSVIEKVHDIISKLENKVWLYKKQYFQYLFKNICTDNFIYYYIYYIYNNAKCL